MRPYGVAVGHGGRVKYKQKGYLGRDSKKWKSSNHWTCEREREVLAHS